MNNWTSNYNPNKKKDSLQVDYSEYSEYTTWNYRKINKSSMNKYSAGILPYTFDINGNCLVLLGRDNDGDWSDFGGRSEFKDRNDEKNTASREFYEETLGSVFSISECINKIGESKKIISKTLNGSPYYMFLVKIDYLNYTDTFNKTANFIKYHYTQNNGHSNNTSNTSNTGNGTGSRQNTEKVNFHKIFEKNTIRWVNINTLINCVENKDFSTQLNLRGVFYKTIQSCVSELINLRKIN